MTEVGSRKRTHDAALGRQRNRNWWGPDVSEESDEENVKDTPGLMPWGVPPPNVPQVRVHSPTPEDQVPTPKRRHVEGEIGEPMHNMSLNEQAIQEDVPDTDMTTGSSYDIAPDRVYVHSLDDSDEENEEVTGDWKVNPYVTQRLDRATRPNRETVPPWLASAQDKPFIEDPGRVQSLVLWQPPVWHQKQEENASQTPDTPDREDRMEP